MQARGLPESTSGTFELGRLSAWRRLITWVNWNLVSMMCEYRAGPWLDNSTSLRFLQIPWSEIRLGNTLKHSLRLARASPDFVGTHFVAFSLFVLSCINLYGCADNFRGNIMLLGSQRRVYNMIVHTYNHPCFYPQHLYHSQCSLHEMPP